MGMRSIITVLTLFILLAYFIISMNTSSISSIERNVRVYESNLAMNIANSAAGLSISKLRDKSWSVSDGQDIFLTTGNNNFDNWSELGGKYRIRAVNNSGTITLFCTGSVTTNQSSSVDYDIIITMTVDNSAGDHPILDSAVFSKSTIDLTGSSKIFGNAGTNATSSGSVNFGWSTQVEGDFYVGPGADYNDVIYSAGWGRKPEDNISGFIGNLDEIREYPLPPYPEFPSNLTVQPNVLIGGNTTGNIYGSGQYDIIRVTGNNNLYIHLNGGETILRVRHLDIQQGHIILQGAGSLTLYVEDEFTLNGSSTINNNGAVINTHMNYSGTVSVNPGGNTRFYGSMYVETADIIIGGSNGIIGHIVSGGANVTITGNAEANVRAVYAPNAHVSLEGSGRVRGAVVANSFSALGNARVFYDDSWEDPIPGFGGSSGGDSVFEVTGWR